MLTDSQIRYMVDRFLGMPIPKDFQPDGGIGFVPLPYSDKVWPSGTNLFDVNQATAMVRYIADGMPSEGLETPHLDKFKTKLWHLIKQAELVSRIDTDEQKKFLIDAAGDAFASGVEVVKAIWKK